MPLPFVFLPVCGAYRKESAKAREAFLEHLSALQAKQGDVGKDGDYSGTIRDIMKTDIVPAARSFKAEMDSVYEKLYGDLAKGALKYLRRRHRRVATIR